MSTTNPRNALLTVVAAAALALWLTPATALAGDAAAGKTVYTANCSSCHGETGKGDGPVGVALPVSPRDFSAGEFKYDADGDGKPGSDADLTLIITKGAAAFGGNPLMAPWPTLSETDVANVIAYVRTLKQ